MFQVFLEHANKAIRIKRRRNLLICDNASWHKSPSLDWGAFEPVYLPGYSPDLNPIGRLWLILKGEWFCDFIAKNKDALMDRIDQAPRWIMDRKEQNSNTCAIKKKVWASTLTVPGAQPVIAERGGGGSGWGPGWAWERSAPCRDR